MGEFLVMSVGLAVGIETTTGATDNLGRLGITPRALAFAAAMTLGLVSMGLYQSRLRVRMSGVLVRIGIGLILGFLLTTLSFFAVPALIVDRGAVLIALAISVAGILVARFAFYHLLDEAYFKRRVLVYGAGQRAASLNKLKRRSDRHGFQIVGFVATHGDLPVVDKNRLVRLSDDLVDFVEQQRVDEIVIAMDDRRLGFPMKALLQCRMQGVRVTELVTFLERESGRVQLDVIHPSWLIFSEGFRRNSVRETLVRALDVIVSMILLSITWPIILLSAIAIKICDGVAAPVLYRQTRVGILGEPFELVKFRTMTVDAEADGAQFAQHRDPRITRIGSILRRTRFDELPQFWNVLRGHMSLVGPRPERPEFVAHFNNALPYYAERHYVKPGLTGWAQLCYPYGATERDTIQKLQFDLYYVKNHSILFDLAIILQTIEVVLWGKGAR